MPLELTDKSAALVGHADINMVEELLNWLRDTQDAEVDVTGCPSAHMGIFQVLLVAQPRIVLPAIHDDNPSDWRQMLVRSGLQLTLMEST